MPLIKSKSKEAFKSNVRAERKAGKPEAQALAIAFRIQRESKKANGGGIASPPFWTRAEAKGLERSGYMHGATPGRSDRIAVNVPVKSYVIPADVVSGLGQGNSNAGAHALNNLFKMGPYGAPRGKQRFADGGEVPSAEIAISDGEYTVPPEKVAELGEGDVDHGHAVLDAFVRHIRSKTIKTLKNLPGPKNS